MPLPQLCAPPPVCAGVDGRIDVATILRSQVFPRCGTPSRAERRRGQRIAFPYPVRLSLPGEDEESRKIVALGRHLSERGLDFYYHRPIEARRVVASLETVDGRTVSLVMLLTWCRFNRHGWYENGGRFLGLAKRDEEAAAPSHGLSVYSAGDPQQLTDLLP